MRNASHLRRGERGGVLLLVVVILATAIAGLAGITSGRALYATRSQRLMEEETRALHSAYAQIHLAMNVINNASYDEENHNLELQDSMAGLHGGTVAGESGVNVDVDPNGSAKNQYGRLKAPAGENTGYVITPKGVHGTGGGNGASAELEAQAANSWLNDPEGVFHGLVRGTNVRVYSGRDYIKRLSKLKGQEIADIDPDGLADSYFVLEAAGRMGHTIRLVSALVRENEPFSSFVFFQNRATLGVSGAPRGLIHSNDKVAFYFPNGSYTDAVSAVGGFEYLAGATVGNTNLKNANPEAARIDLEKVDFADLKGKADLFVGQDGLDAEIRLYASGKVRIREFTPPRYETVTRSRSYQRRTGWHWETYTATKKKQVGTIQVPYQDRVIDHYDYEDYWVNERIRTGTTTETRIRTVTVQTGTRKVKKTRQEPVYEERTVTKTRRVKKWVPYNGGNAGGGTSVGGGGSGELGEWVWVEEPYEVIEMVRVGTKTVTYWVDEPVYERTKEAYQVKVPVYENKMVLKTRKVPVYATVTKLRTEPVYESVQVEKKKKVDDYETVTETWQEEQFMAPVEKRRSYVHLNSDEGSTIFIDGRITKLYGDLNGRLTLVGNEKVRITDNIRYVDKSGKSAMEHGGDFTKPYERNPAYQGSSVLGVIARDDILFARSLPSQAEINGTLMAVNGRVGVDGFWADDTGELHKDGSKAREAYLTPEQRKLEGAYDRVGAYGTRVFTKDSLRRIGGVISNNRVMETYITTSKDGTSKVAAGFKRGNMKFDISLLFNPPPNFVVVPRPVLTYFVPILAVRDRDA